MKINRTRLGSVFFLTLLVAACGGNAENESERRASTGSGSGADAAAGEDAGARGGDAAVEREEAEEESSVEEAGEKGNEPEERPEGVPEGAKEVERTASLKVFSSEEGTTVVTESGDTFTVPPDEEGVVVTESGQVVVVSESGDVIVLEDPEAAVQEPDSAGEMASQPDDVSPGVVIDSSGPIAIPPAVGPAPGLPAIGRFAPLPADVDYPQGAPEPQALPPREIPPAAGQSPAELQAETQELEQRASRVACKCEAAEFPGEYPPDYLEQCSRYRYGGNEPPPVSQCIIDILDSTASGDAALLCRRDLTAELAECVTQAGCDWEKRSVCEQAYYTKGQTECETPPYDVDAQIQLQCWGQQLPPPMVCDDGSRIHAHLLCNYREDCPGGEDEDDMYCPGPEVHPESGYAICRDGSWLPLEFLCNGEPNCQDGWDESEEICAEYSRDNGNFTCSDGAVIPQQWVCDGDADCNSGEDEGAQCTPVAAPPAAAPAGGSSSMPAATPVGTASPAP